MEVGLLWATLPVEVRFAPQGLEVTQLLGVGMVNQVSQVGVNQRVETQVVGVVETQARLWRQETRIQWAGLPVQGTAIGKVKATVEEGVKVNWKVAVMVLEEVAVVVKQASLGWTLLKENGNYFDKK